MPPPDGLTGARGVAPTRSQVVAWLSTNGDGNVALRLPPDVVGIDVDAYNGGRSTLTDLEVDLGPLPHTWMSTARSDGSGIRLYRVPNGTRMAGSAGAGVDIVQTAHRYVVAPPSIHPTVGTPYRWLDTGSGEVADLPPEPGELPELPWSWVERLRSTSTSTNVERAATTEEVAAFIDAHTGTDKPAGLRGLSTILHRTTGARHDALVDLACKAMREAMAGHYPAADAVKVLRDWWRTAMTDPARRDGPEFAHALAWAVAAVTAEAATEEGAARIENMRVTPFDIFATPSPPDAAVDLLAPVEPVDRLPAPVKWADLFSRQFTADWLVEDLWPAGRQVHLFAARKAGKSLLMLWIAASLAAGRDPFSGDARPAERVMYLDYEMSEEDLRERLEDMGFTPDDLEQLTYYLHPPIPPLDTADGGAALLELIDRDDAKIVVLDTVSRIVAGEENSADTFRNLWRHTGARLKERGVSLARLDHEGHESGRSRGSSAKADDVDIVWRLAPTEGGGFILTRKAARVSYVPEKFTVTRSDGPLGFRRVEASWPAGTKELADLLDELEVPVDAGRRTVATRLREAGHPTRTEVVTAAQRWRRTDTSRHLRTG